VNLAQLPDGLDGTLIHVEEECAEVVQEVCKVRRFGLHSSHPREPEKGSNHTRLMTEIGQLRRALDRLEEELARETRPSWI